MSCWASLYCRGVSVVTVARLYITHTSNFSFCGDWERLSFIYFFPFLNIFFFYDFVIRLMFISPFFLSFFFSFSCFKIPLCGNWERYIIFFLSRLYFLPRFSGLVDVGVLFSFFPSCFFLSVVSFFFFYFPYVATEIALLFFYLFSKRFSLWLFWYEWCPYLWIISPFFKIFLMFQLGKLLLLFSLPNFYFLRLYDATDVYLLSSFLIFLFFSILLMWQLRNLYYFYFTFFPFYLCLSLHFFFFTSLMTVSLFLSFLFSPIFLFYCLQLFFFFLFLSMVSLIFQTVFKVFWFTSLIFLFFFPFFSFPFLLFSSPIPTLHFPLIWYSTKALFFYIYFKSHLHYVSNCSVFSSPYRILYWQRTIAYFPHYNIILLLLAWNATLFLFSWSIHIFTFLHYLFLEVEVKGTLREGQEGTTRSPFFSC